MEAKRYQEYLDSFLKSYEIRHVEAHPGLVRVDMVPNDRWCTCTFIFTERFITCFGDIASYTWRTTWDAAEKIQRGSCNAEDLCYLLGKLEHQDRLKEFNVTDEALVKIKQECADYSGLEGKELDEFNEKWEDNSYLLGDVDEHHLDKLEEFFGEMEIDDYCEYYSDFEDWPDTCYLAVAMLRCIEDYFKREKAQESTVPAV